MGTKDPAYLALDDLLRAGAERLAPSGSADERQRRARPFPLKQLSACAVASCSLRQSELKLVPQ